LRNDGALGWSCACNDHWYHLHASCGLAYDATADGLRSRVTMRAGEKHYFSLSYVQNDVGVIPPLGEQAEYRLRCTQDWWRRWSDSCRYEGPYRKQVMRSAITLKLLHYSLSGAVVAAPTSSLPEAVGADRNWDYRFCWLRDASITLRAFNGIGYYYEGEAFLDWLLHATRLTLPRLQVVYDIFGETELRETALPHLEGYRGSRPVRIGNGAHPQRQLDVYGNVIAAAAEHARCGGGLDRYDQHLLLQLGDTIRREWRLPDHSIWELRGEPRHYTYSKFMCWLGLHCLLRMHVEGHLRADASRLQQECAAIRREIENRAYWPDLNAYSGLFDEQMIDASLLMMGLEGYLPPDDPRMRGLLEYVRRHLEKGVHVYRYCMPGDDMRRKEGSFALCSFWAVELETLVGDAARARENFEELLGCANDVGLYAEQIDPASGAHLGNFPQAFTHVGVINAALGLRKLEARKSPSPGSRHRKPHDR
jgi:GH15 family glucan-1,4-alpha-glucosidase